MNIDINPINFTFTLEFLLDDKKFNAILYQDLASNEKVVTLLNQDGTHIENSELSDKIAAYIIERYSIDYGSSDDSLDIIVGQEDAPFDPPI
jgi:hypothetical protein